MDPHDLARLERAMAQKVELFIENLVRRRSAPIALVCGLVSLVAVVVLVANPDWAQYPASGLLYIPAILGIAASVQSIRQGDGMAQSLVGLAGSGPLFALLIWATYVAFR